MQESKVIPKSLLAWSSLEGSPKHAYLNLSNIEVYVESCLALIPDVFGDTVRECTRQHFRRFIYNLDTSVLSQSYSYVGTKELVSSCKQQFEELQDFLNSVISSLVIEGNVKVVSKHGFTTVAKQLSDGSYQYFFDKNRYPRGYSNLFKGFVKCVSLIENTLTAEDINLLAISYMTMARSFNLIQPDEHFLDLMHLEAIDGTKRENHLNPNGIQSSEDYDWFMGYYSDFKAKVIEVAGMSRIPADRGDLLKFSKRFRSIVNLYRQYRRICTRSYNEERDGYFSTSSSGTSVMTQYGVFMQTNAIYSKPFESPELIKSNFKPNKYCDPDITLRFQESYDATIELRSILNVPDTDYLDAKQFGINVRADIGTNLMITQIQRFKGRMISHSNNFQQEPCAYIHNVLMDGLSTIPQSCCMNQGKGKNLLKNLTMQSKYNHASYDLSKATDTLDLFVQEDILSWLVFGPESQIPSLWRKIMQSPLKVKNPEYKPNYIYMHNGQPAGYLSSFPMLELTNIIMTALCFFIEDEDDETDIARLCALLGDDTLKGFLLKASSLTYPRVMRVANVFCGLNKGYLSIIGETVNRGEFAKVIYCNGMLMSGLSTNVVSKMFNNTYYCYSVLRLLTDNGLVSFENDSDSEDYYTSSGLRMLRNSSFQRMLPSQEILTGYRPILPFYIDKEGEDNIIDYNDIILTNAKLPSYIGGLVSSSTFDTIHSDIPEGLSSQFNKLAFKVYLILRLSSIGLKTVLKKSLSNNVSEYILKHTHTQSKQNELYIQSLHTFVYRLDETVQEIFRMYADSPGKRNPLEKLVNKARFFDMIKANYFDFSSVSQEQISVLESVSLGLSVEEVVNSLRDLKSFNKMVELISQPSEELTDNDIMLVSRNLSALESNKFRANRAPQLESDLMITMSRFKAWFLRDPMKCLDFIDYGDRRIDDDLVDTEDLSYILDIVNQLDLVDFC